MLSQNPEKPCRGWSSWARHLAGSPNLPGLDLGPRIFQERLISVHTLNQSKGCPKIVNGWKGIFAGKFLKGARCAHEPSFF